MRNTIHLSTETPAGTITVGDKVQLKGITEEDRVNDDLLDGVIRKIEPNGKSYDLFIYWQDSDATIRTPLDYFLDNMEII